MRRYNIGGPQGAAALITLALWSALSVASAGDDLPIRFQARVLWIAAQTLLVDIMAVVAVRPAAAGKSKGPATGAMHAPVAGPASISSRRDVRIGPEQTEVHGPALVIFGDGDLVEASRATAAARFLLAAARPLHEPIARYGPFVMNTRAEIEQALQELRTGRFIRDEPRDV